MGIKLFKTIRECVTKFETFFEQRRNAAGELGHYSPDPKFFI
jgi:hypothetical protein